MKRLIYAAMRFAKRETITLEERNIHYNRYLRRLDEIAAIQYIDKDVLRLLKRIKRCREGFFTFVKIPNVEPTNNFGEQKIRGTVIMRKNSFHTMSEQGSETKIHCSSLISYSFFMNQKYQFVNTDSLVGNE